MFLSHGAVDTAQRHGFDMTTTMIPSLLDSPTATAWLKQFRLQDQRRAAELLSNFRLVSRDEFADSLRDLVISRADAITGPVGLYAERELRMRLGVPNRLFKETNRKLKRAYGVGPQAVKPTKAYDTSVGSEGLVAQLITELCRANPTKFFNHPGPDQIRAKRVRAIFVVTDLVGSGKRAKTYLEAAWRVRSVRSWWSGRFLRFEVVSFAATERGKKVVGSHHCKPLVSAVIPCPTIQSSYDREEADFVEKLCVAYDPIKKDAVESLGVGGLGALIAFAHGVPNNAPRIFHKKGAKWTPLFPARVTADIATGHFGRSLTGAAIEKRLNSINQRVLARSLAATSASDETKMMLLLMAALGRSPRLSDVLALRTGLTIPEIDQICQKLAKLGWIDRNRRLTDAGLGQLSHAKAKLARKRRRAKAMVVKAEKTPYYPQSLRAPI